MTKPSSEETVAAPVTARHQPLFTTLTHGEPLSGSNPAKGWRLCRLTNLEAARRSAAGVLGDRPNAWLARDADEWPVRLVSVRKQ